MGTRRRSILPIATDTISKKSETKVHRDRFGGLDLESEGEAIETREE